MVQEKVQKRQFNRLKEAIERDEMLSSINPKIIAVILIANIMFQLVERGGAIFQYVGILALIVGLFSLKDEEYAFLLVGTQTCNRLMTLFGVSLLNVITILYFCQRYIFKKSFDKVRLNGKLLLPFAVFLTYCSQYVIIKENIRDILIVIKLYFTIVFLVDVIESIKTREEMKIYLGMLKIYFTLGIVITCLSAQFLNPDIIDESRFAVSEASSTNILSVYIAVCIAFLLISLYASNSKIMDIFMITMLTALSYIGFATQSRTFSILIIFSFVWIIGFGIYNRKTRNRTLFYTFLMILIIVLFMTFATETSLYVNVENTIDRFINPKNGDVTNGRTQIWAVYFNAIFNNARIFLTGDGAGGERVAGGVMAHNMYIEIFYAYGLIGTIIVIWMYTVFYKLLANKFKSLGFSPIPFGFLPFIITFMAGMSSHSLLAMAQTVEFFLGVCAIYSAEFSTFGKKKKVFSFTKHSEKYEVSVEDNQ